MTSAAPPSLDTSRPRIQYGDIVWACALAAILLALNVAWVASRLGLVHKPRYVLETDHLVYIEMAKQPLGGRPGTLAREAPFCWRVLTPALVRSLMGLGLRVHAAFYLLTQAGLFVFLAALFALIRMRGFRREEAALGVILVGLLPGAVRWYEYQYWMSDPLALASLVAALVVYEAGRERQLLWLGPLSALIRESYVLIVPYLALRRWRESGLTPAAKTLAVAAILPAGVWLLLRLAIVPDNPSRWGSALVAGLAYRLGHLGTDELYALSVGSFGAMAIVPCIWPLRTLRALARRSPEAVFLLAVSLTLLVASNTDRLLAYGLPVVVPLFLLAMRRAAAEWGVSPGTLGLVVVALQLHLFVATPFRRPGLSVRPEADSAVVATYLAATALGLGLRWRRAQARARADTLSPPR